MSLVENKRDIIIVTGCNVVGKTTASNYLRKLVTLRKIPSGKRLISDSQCLFKTMLKDDEEGGLHHTHDWCKKDTRGHKHNPGQPVFPFTVTDNELPDRMRQDFFSKLRTLPRNGNLWFVEWAAGVNTNPSDNPISYIDYSYTTVKKMLQGETLPDIWLKRVKVVIHLKADNNVRHCLNEKSYISSFTQSAVLEQGTASWLKDERILNFYGKDDFSEIESVFRNADIPIYPVKNDGTCTFFNLLKIAAETIFTASLVEDNEILVPL